MSSSIRTRRHEMTDQKIGTEGGRPPAEDTAPPHDPLYRQYVRYLAEKREEFSQGVAVGSKTFAVLESRFTPMTLSAFQAYLLGLSPLERSAFEERVRSGYRKELDDATEQVLLRLSTTGPNPPR
jgi:hypothetical protein